MQVERLMAELESGWAANPTYIDLPRPYSAEHEHPGGALRGINNRAKNNYAKVLMAAAGLFSLVACSEGKADFQNRSPLAPSAATGVSETAPSSNYGEVQNSPSGTSTRSRSRFVPANRPALGRIESADCNRIKGWAIDLDDPYTPINIHVYRDGPAGSGHLVGGYTTGVRRYDLDPIIGYSVIDAGFDFKTPIEFIDNKAHTLYIHAIDHEGWPNNLLDNKNSGKYNYWGFPGPRILVCAFPPRPTPGR